MSTSHRTETRRSLPGLAPGAILLLAATSSTPQQFGDLMAKERVKWAELIKEAHITLN